METVKDRLKHFIKTLGVSVNAFEKKWGTGQSYVNNISKGIGNEYLTNLCNLYPELNLNWLFTGKGSMLIPESENLSENKSNLAKQSEDCGRNSSVDEIIMDLTKRTVMEQIPAIIKAVGEAMRESRVDENSNIQKYLDNQKELSAMQMEIFRDIVKILAKSDPDAKEIDTKLRQFNMKIG